MWNGPNPGGYQLLHVANNAVGLAGTTVFDRRARTEDFERRVSLDILFLANVLLDRAVNLGKRDPGGLELRRGLFIFGGERWKEIVAKTNDTIDWVKR